MTGYRIFNHTADLGIKVTADTLEGLYAEAALALFDLLADRGAIRPAEERTVLAGGEDPADLFVNFLREVLYLWNGTGFLARECAVRDIDSRRLTALLSGEAFDPTRHRIKKEIKAVTYHQASVRKTAKGWVGTVVFDV